MLACKHDNARQQEGQHMAKATVTKTVRLPTPLAEKLEAAARVTGNSENQVVVTAVANYVGRPSIWEQIEAEGKKG
jgi:predicted transcriptional regulator